MLLLLLLLLLGGVNLFRHVLCKQDLVSPLNFKSTCYLTPNINSSRKKKLHGGNEDVRRVQTLLEIRHLFETNAENYLFKN